VCLLNIEYVVGGEELLLFVGHLWEKLNMHHQVNSRHFSNRYLNMTFEQRQAVWMEKAKTGYLRIELVKDQDSKDFVGYCVSTITNKVVGEIESIFIDQMYRKLGIGDYLMGSSLKWLDKQLVTKKRICVVGGNEQVLTFYSHYGFFPKLLYLEQT
jgi:ribosomal protein S18 acetylase RimI-like enzyme